MHSPASLNPLFCSGLGRSGARMESPRFPVHHMKTWPATPSPSLCRSPVLYCACICCQEEEKRCCEVSIDVQQLAGRQVMAFTPICALQVAPGRYAAIEAPRTPRALAQTKLNASAIRTGSPVDRWRSKEGLQDVEEWDEFARRQGVVRVFRSYYRVCLYSDFLTPSHRLCDSQEHDPSGHLRARKTIPLW